MAIGQKKGFRHSEEVKSRISETLKSRGQPIWLKQKRACTICGEMLKVANYTRHLRACEDRAKYVGLADMSLIEIKKLRIDLRQYGLNIDGYFHLLKKQGGGCAICGLPDNSNGRRLYVDHCHETGVVRGLLCSTCNLMIGYAKEDRELLQRAVAYLDRTDARNYDRDGWDSASPKRVA